MSPERAQWQHEADVFQTGALHQKVEALKNHRHAAAKLAQFTSPERADIYAVNHHAAFAGTLEHIDTANQSAFSSAAHSDDTENITVADGDVDVFQCLECAVSRGEGFGQVFNLNHNCRLSDSLYKYAPIEAVRSAQSFI